MEDITPKYLKKEAIESLNKRLILPALDPYSQDWEYELADSSKLNEFITYYEKSTLTIDEKFALMALIISSFDDSLSEGKLSDHTRDTIKYLLIKDIEIHRNKIKYWAREEEDELEDCFAVTPLMREILDKQKQ
ncbi:hypothetical protein [Paenibacillus harenae]|uniref:hypothetical protein n=1 Tax=Paenibacillus harenae TaxID=306543 RepID=UPI00278FDF0D|nr:hypothetical protein [Paenibacillus harenae]MDQ0059992.1 hypothetical protein [Paenibacillus harenae]